MLSLKKRSSLLTVLVCLTLLSICAQIIFFAIHNHASELLDDLVGSSLSAGVFHSAIILPLIEFILLQIGAYIIFISLIWFVSVSCAEVFKTSAYYLGVFFWLSASIAIYTLNVHYFPNSFFARGLVDSSYLNIILILSTGISLLGLMLAYYHLYQQRRRLFAGMVFLSLLLVNIAAAGLNLYTSQYKQQLSQKQPNVIIIGIDSLRPDYIGLAGQHAVKTPHIDTFLKTGVHFTQTYTPLARTFPAWVSILTGKYPKNNHARINLEFAKPIWGNDTLAKKLKLAGYETLYASDEKRFSNITHELGFDQIVGPEMGLNDFILGSLSDFPLTNLLINLPLGRYVFPYNYANRAAAITYEPNNFLQLLETSLHKRSEKPLFLAIHFCVTHWPFTWAQDKQQHKLSLEQRYQHSIEKADQQLGELMQILEKSGLLKNTLVVLLSDHGTSFGFPGDRIIDRAHYQGDPEKMSWIPLNKLSKASTSSLDLKANYSISAAYGQGTDVLSMRQYQVLLGFKYFGQHAAFPAHREQAPSALIDIAPTILQYLHQQPLKNIDGISLVPELLKFTKQTRNLDRVLFLESGYSISEIQTNQIEAEKVLKTSIHLYSVNPKDGYLFIKPSEESAVLANKQRAVVKGDWILARYPDRDQNILVASENKLVFKTKLLPAYYVLVNVKTRQWSIGLDSALARSAPIENLHQQLLNFYGHEI